MTLQIAVLNWFIKTMSRIVKEQEIGASVLLKKKGGPSALPSTDLCELPDFAIFVMVSTLECFQNNYEIEVWKLTHAGG